MPALALQHFSVILLSDTCCVDGVGLTVHTQSVKDANRLSTAHKLRFGFGTGFNNGFSMRFSIIFSNGFSTIWCLP